MPDDPSPTRPFGRHPAGPAVLAIVERVLALPLDDPIWREAAAVNVATAPVRAAYRRGAINAVAFLDRLATLTEPVEADVLIAATVLLSAEATTHPLPGSPN